MTKGSVAKVTNAIRYVRSLPCNSAIQFRKVGGGAFCGIHR